MLPTVVPHTAWPCTVYRRAPRRRRRTCPRLLAACVWLCGVVGWVMAVLGGGRPILCPPRHHNRRAAAGTSHAVGVADRGADGVVMAVAAAGRGEAAVVAGDARVGGGRAAAAAGGVPRWWRARGRLRPPSGGGRPTGAGVNGAAVPMPPVRGA